MASTSSAPPSSDASSSSSSASSSKLSSLPVMSLRRKIVEKIRENRVTLIVGETGCGKSSQVPQFLLEAKMDPILCTQPRRFAVVAVAKMVATSRNCEVGGEVGYHIGHSKVVSSRTKIFFKTAGVLLEEMRENGLNALKYKVIILDEVHERSVESDLVLVCVKQFLLKNNDLRLVLMSATANIARYRDYFKDLSRGERVEVLAIPSSTHHNIFQRRVLYLEQVNDLLGVSHNSFSSGYCSGQTPSAVDPEIRPEVHKLIHELVIHIHKNEPDIEKSILVFLPTYYSLEQQWCLLNPYSSAFKIHILHRSIDTEQALAAMKICKSHRKVILATNIAESSVTIPQVAFVIDSCRSLQVFWDNARKKEYAELVWVSKSQAEQRRGRTGRTCDGQVYRLVTRSFFNCLEEYECPSILRLSLRLQVLLICCSDSRAMNDPKALLQKALDPPAPEVVEDALHLLVQIKALEKLPPRGRYEPTFYGWLLASFSLSFDASVLILKFGAIGMLREGILLGILMDTLPLPIVRPFGQENLFAEYTDCYFSEDGKKPVLAGKRELLFMGNLCAFQFWQRVFKDKHRLGRLKKLWKSDEIKSYENSLPEIEEEWCSLHNLVQSSLHNVSEIYEDALNAVHRFRPKFLATSGGLPSYFDPYDFDHTCLVECQQKEDLHLYSLIDEQLGQTTETRKCVAVPFVASGHFQSNKVAASFATVIKELRMQYMEEAPADQHDYDNGGKASLCRFFVSGSCDWGNECLFSHSLQAKRPVCKFFFSYQGCRNGNSCFFSHNLGSSAPFNSKPSLCLQEDESAEAQSLLCLLPLSEDRCILLLDDIDLHFSSNISHHFDPSKIVSTTSLPHVTLCDPSLIGIKILWGLNHPDLTISLEAAESPIPWNEVSCVLWFPNFSSYGENLEKQKRLMQRFFEYLAVRLLADALRDVRVILTMNNIRFSLLQVENLARDSFFFLQQSFPFDESSFGELPDIITNKKAMVVSRPISYVFELYPPSHRQFGDFATELHRHLYNV